MMMMATVTQRALTQEWALQGGTTHLLHAVRVQPAIVRPHQQQRVPPGLTGAPVPRPLPGPWPPGARQAQQGREAEQVPIELQRAQNRWLLLRYRRARARREVQGREGEHAQHAARSSTVGKAAAVCGRCVCSQSRGCQTADCRSFQQAGRHGRQGWRAEGLRGVGRGRG